MSCFLNITACSCFFLFFIGCIDFLVSKKKPILKRYAIGLLALILVRLLFFSDLYSQEYSESERLRNIQEFKEKSEIYSREALKILEEIESYKPWLLNADIRDKEIAERSVAILIAYLVPPDLRSKLVATSIVVLEQVLQRSIQDVVFLTNKLEKMKVCIESSNFFYEMATYLEKRSFPENNFIITDIDYQKNKAEIYRDGICSFTVYFSLRYREYENLLDELKCKNEDGHCFETDDDDICMDLEGSIRVIRRGAVRINFPIIQTTPSEPIFGTLNYYEHLVVHGLTNSGIPIL